ncbi:hypothetical protein C1E24_15930 [Pseudoalteromonas phenolica]|uniref:Uncharacterized protein n=1 Tax=Pseudoalteromonas phenolica TaxID=161398 RepID=A0A5R9PZA7_9GAMM|nr:hypothetical protein [Pseudoalteromonas phenolica]TLX46005.1 hypothetical protein C1E24_15930 [Pseudoalteromonas phenolica]
MLKVKALLLIVFLMFGNFYSYASTFTDEDNKTEQWQLGTTKRFDTFQNFFLKYGSDAYFRTAYLYDLEKQQWLSYEDAKSLKPALQPILNVQYMDVKLTLAEVVSFTNVDIRDAKRYALFFFDTPIDTGNNNEYLFAGNEVFAKQLKKSIEMRKLAAKLVKQQHDVTGYLIQIPLIGYKPQTF